MKVSIVIAVLDSHEIVKRQLQYFQKMPLPKGVELIIVDDGSDPAFIDMTSGKLINANGERRIKLSDPNALIIETKDYRKWTQGLARMKGIELAKGEYIFCTDIDHIISKEALDFAVDFTADKAVFVRRFAYLDEDGNLVRDKDKLLEWGLLETAIRDNELSSGVHGNTWLMRKDLFWDLGGYNLDRCNSGTHLQGEDREFNSRFIRAVRRKKALDQVQGPPIYFFPMGKYHRNDDENPFGYFHKLYKERWGDK